VPEIDHEIRIAAAPEQVYAALTTRDGLVGWHNPTVTGTGDVGGEWVFAFADHPEFGWRIVESTAPTRVVWECTRGPGDSVGTTATFTLSATADGRTLVEHVHAGWPGTHGNFRKCNTTWGVLLHHLRDYVETGDPVPAFG
jgi:uncharacterized protein YndB with AHSA1/START domain